MEIKLNSYIKGFECVGINNKIKSITGWVDNFIYEGNKNIIGYVIQADDSYKGYRGTSVMKKYGNIQFISDNILRPIIRQF